MRDRSMSSDHKATMDFPKEQARGTNTNTQQHIVHPGVQKQGALKGSQLFYQKLQKQGMRFPRCKSRGRQQAPNLSLKIHEKLKHFQKPLKTRACEPPSAKAGNAPSLRGESPSLPIFNDRARLRPQRVDKEERREMHKEQRRERKRKKEKIKHKGLGKKKFHAVWKAEGVIVKKKPAMRRQLAK